MKKSLIIAAMFLTACGGGTVKNYVSEDGKLHGELSLSGAFALYPLAVEWADEFKKNNPDVKVDVSAGGAGKGMTDVLAGMVDFGMVSREFYHPKLRKARWVSRRQRMPLCLPSTLKILPCKPFSLRDLPKKLPRKFGLTAA